MVVHQNRSPTQQDLYTKQRRFLNITLLTLSSPAPVRPLPEDKAPKAEGQIFTHSTWSPKLEYLCFITVAPCQQRADLV